MFSLKRLRETLQEEATAEIAVIRTDTEGKVAAIEAAARNKAEEVKAEILAGVDQEIEELHRRTEAEARLMRRRISVSAKAELADEAMRRAGVMLEELPEERYRDFLVKLLQEAVPHQGEAHVVLNERDRSRFGDDLLRKVETALTAKGYHIRLRMAPDAGFMSGGFRLIGADFEVDASLECLLANAGELLEPEIARVLFENDR
jgi:vacuolar-type H+-ATPase subunit E/Vma4